MTRTAIDILVRQLPDGAFCRNDPFHALRKNLEGVTAAEWDIRPGVRRVEEFGSDASLAAPTAGT